jgi:nucleoside-diphosphate-sugar epimerase
LDPVKGQRPGYIYTEDDWNPVTAETAGSNSVVAYLASKTFAEKAAWEYIKDNKVNISNLL